MPLLTKDTQKRKKKKWDFRYEGLRTRKVQLKIWNSKGQKSDFRVQIITDYRVQPTNEKRHKFIIFIMHITFPSEIIWQY